MKLTDAQKERLAYMAKQPDGSCYALDTYKPTRKLVELGLATRTPAKFGNAKFTITPAGRAALEAREGE